MTLIGFMLQALALVVLFKRLGRRWLTHVGAIFIVMAVLYHGVAEIALWLFPGYDPYRLLVAPAAVDQFILWISAAILIFTLAYVVALGRTTRSDAEAISGLPKASIFGWKLTLIALIPLAIISLQGRGAADVQNQAVGSGLGLAQQFFLLAVVLAGFEFVMRFGRRSLLPVLIVQSALISIVVAERFIIFAAIGLLLYGLARVGIRLSRIQIAVGSIAAVILILGITSARANVGRFATSADASVRFQSFIAGLASIGSPATWQTVGSDIGYRLDGNSFGAMELWALDSGQPPLGPAPLVNDVLIAVPSFINPQKDASDPALRSSKLYAEEHLNLTALEVVPGTWLDILPTQLGGIVGIGGTWSMLFVAVVLGLLFAAADRWLLRALTPTRLLIGLGLFQCVFYYERSLDTYTLTFRGIVPLLIAAWLLRRLRTFYTRPALGPRGIARPMVRDQIVEIEPFSS